MPRARSLRPPSNVPVVAGEDEEWPPRAARLTSAFWSAESHFERREFFAAARALDVVRGAGRGRFRRRAPPSGCGGSGPFLPAYREIELESLLDAVSEVVDLDAVSEVVESADGDPDGDTELA